MDKERFAKDDVVRMGAQWMDRLRAAEKREDDWRKEAEEAEAAYLCDGTGTWGVPSFNILHSNVETIVPAIYNSTPSPDIRPRHNGTDDLGKQFADALERAISTQIDDDRLNQEIEFTCQDSEVSGRGVTRVRFDADDDDTGNPVNERVTFENVSWRDYREGPATRWANVPWVAYRYMISTEEMNRLSDEDVMAHYETTFDEEEGELDVSLWEIWDRENKKVLFLIEDNQRLIAVKDDPLGLTGFFPSPQPVQPVTGSGKRTPVVPYQAYRKLAEELDLATKRINKIMTGLKVRGIIAGNAEVIELLNQAEDNELVASSDLMGQVATGNLDSMISWWPVETAVAVLVQLYQQREATKQAIYEITGISDIVRGSSDARETAAAQQIKTQWGSQRVKRRQRMIQSHIRDLFLLTSEIIAKLFSPQAFFKAAGVPPSPELAQMIGQMDHFRIDVESDSTVRSDLDRQRGEMSQFLEATGGFFQVMAPLVAQKPELAQGVAEIYAAFTRSFQLGKQAEDAIDQMTQMAAQTAKEPKPNPAEEMAKQEMQMKQQELQMKQGEMQMRGQESQAKMQVEQGRAALDMQKLQADVMLRKMDIALKAQQIGIEVDKVELQAEKDQIDAFLKIEEMEIERTQERPVAIGESA